MKKTRRKKSYTPRASTAVKSLRELMSLTQGQFAKLMKVVMATVNRWENAQPPQGDALLRLAEMCNRESERDEYTQAQRARFRELFQLFRGLELEEKFISHWARTQASGACLITQFTEKPPDIGHMILKIQSEPELQACHDFWHVISDLRSDPNMEPAREALRMLREMGEKIYQRLSREIDEK